MKRLIFLPMLCWAALLVAQEKYNAIILEDEESFVMSAPTSGTYNVRRTVRVFNDAGLDEAVFQEYTDQFRSLSSFKGTLERENGKPLKLKKDDLVMVSVASGLAEDGFVHGYQPSSTYPFTVTYEYTITYRKGVASFPTFFPVSSEKVKVEKASYTFQVPSGTKINCVTSKVGDVRKETGKADTYRWEVPVFEGYTAEMLMPSWREVVPYVFACPADFTYAGMNGSQATWEHVGAWIHGLREGTDDLPESFRAELKEMTAKAGSDLEKIRILYDYLREHTRYVSIQLGIGGYKPFPASQVHKTGFGDCKGLSNYMQSMLDAVGIPSYYTLVNTNRADFLPGYSGVGQMNHVMLCVPLPEKKDTLWLECTNPAVPLGYRHEDVAGHEVVVTQAGGGIPVRVPAYADTLSRDVCELDLELAPDGAAKATVKRSLYLDETESWLSIRDWKPDTRRSRLTSGLTVQPQEVTLTGVQDNFRDYDGPDFCPWMEVDYTFDTRQYATTGKDRLFVPVNPHPKGASLQRGKRQNDLVCKQGGIERDRIRIHLPAGYKPESLPNPVSLDTEWGTFTSSCELKDGTVVVFQEFITKRFREPAERFDDFRTFVRAVNKAYQANLVLVKE
jgi:transglutaminase-like putative cysteine protease